MCTYCMQYGEGTRWYLNPRNFREEARNLPHVINSGMIEIFGGNAKMDLEIGTAAGLDTLIESRHGGQIVTVEEVNKIIQVVPPA